MISLSYIMNIANWVASTNVYKPESYIYINIEQFLNIIMLKAINQILISYSFQVVYCKHFCLSQ